MTWVKAELTDEQNEWVEQYQDAYDLSKPDAVAALVSDGALWNGLRDGETND